jgi:hypothetical protein
MKTYGSSTEDFLKNVSAKEPKDYTLKQIAQNLAYIADELSQGNEELHKIGNDVFCVRDFLECDLGPIIHGSHNSDDNDSKGGDISEKCFICGKSIRHLPTGGAIIDSHGNVTIACEECGPKFDAIIGDIVGRKVHC